MSRHQVANAATFYVSTTGSDSNPGSQAAPFATVSKAITASSNGDTVVIMDGTYTYSTTLTVDKTLTITSQNGKASTTLVKSFVPNDASALLSIKANGVIITALTLQQSNDESTIIGIERDSIGYNPPTLYTGTTITNNNLVIYKYGIGVNGGDTTITGNTFSRSPVTPTTYKLYAMLIYYIRGSTTICNNSWMDSVYPRRFIDLTGSGASGSDYLDRINSKGGTLTVCDNALQICNTNDPTKEVQIVNQDTWNQYVYGPIGPNADYNANTKLTYVIKNNNIQSSPCPSSLITPYLSNGGDLTMVNYYNVANNHLDKSFSAMVKMDAGGAVTISSSDTSRPVFYMESNTITNWQKAASLTGDKNFVQTSVISPPNLYLNTVFIVVSPSRSASCRMTIKRSRERTRVCFGRSLRQAPLCLSTSLR